MVKLICQGKTGNKVSGHAGLRPEFLKHGGKLLYCSGYSAYIKPFAAPELKRRKEHCHGKDSEFSG
jgi:hypothetical protein